MDANQGNRKAFLLVVLVFVMGIALGSLGTYVVTTRVQAARPQTVHNPMAALTRELSLTPAQQTQIQTILSETRARYAEIHKQVDPEYESARHEGREQIRQLLTPEQKPKFEELLQRWDMERQKRDSEGREQSSKR